MGPVAPLHGLGGAKDLPVPPELAIAGGSAALVVSFCVLVLAWRTPRYGDRRSPREGRPVPAGLARVLDSGGFTWTVRLLGLAFAYYLIWALLAGPDVVTNPVFGTFYVLLWVGIVPASLVWGRVYAAVSPVRTVNALLAKATGGDPGQGMFTYPERLGCWPAAAGLFAFVWQELVNPQSAYIGPVRLWLAVYLAVMLIGGALFGDTWFARADPFEVYSNLLAKLSFWGRDAQGRLVWRSPLANLATLVPRPGLVAVVAVLFGSTAFDSYKDTLSWVRFVNKLDVNLQLVNTAALLGFCAVIGISFAVATMFTGVDPASPYAATRRVLPRLFAHSVVPIIVGYMTAHYLSYLVEQGQVTLMQLSDPMVNGSNLLGTRDWGVNYFLFLHPTLLATIKVLAVVVGHIVGVVAAHDRALMLLPKRHQVTGQLGLLVIMLAYTSTGLYLLFGT
ncbi:MAG: hypothetical protein J7518_20210 [Nocardioidaceae bacterium]|nr:hypothetical protein [Nocardioidaceae bacterium]